MLLEAFTGKRKCNNKDDFGNKRWDLVGKLLEGELGAHILHSWKRLSKALQRDLYEKATIKVVEHCLDASIIVNGLSGKFSTKA